MSETKYQIVIFNNQSKKRIVATSRIQSNIIKKYNQIIKKSNVIFPMKYNKKKKCNFEISLVCIGKCKNKALHKRDELGRLLEVTTKNKKYQIIKIQNFEVAEKIYDHRQQKRITVEDFIREYLTTTNIIQLYTLNNKVVVQNNDDFFLFSLKNISDASRLLTIVQSYFRENKKFNCLFSKDLSTAQRKEIYNTLESKGFSRQLLYKHYTY